MTIDFINKLSIKFIIGLLLFFPHNGNSQSTYTFEDFIEAGDNQLFSRSGILIDVYGFAATGADYSWNFPELPIESQFTESYLSSATSTYKWPWCFGEGYLWTCTEEWDNLTNMRSVSLDTTDFGIVSLYNSSRHFKKEDNLFKETLTGIVADFGVPLPLQFEFSDYDTIYQFPFNYGDVDSSTSELILDFVPLGLPFSQSTNKKRINTIDGWGDLTTPYGYFPEVLRMKTVIESKDTTKIDEIEIPINAISVEYKWFSSLYSSPVLTVKGSIIFGIEFINEVIYIDSLECIEPNAFFIYDPFLPIIDSTLGYVNVNFYNFSTNADSVTWNFGDGSSSSDYNTNHNFYCAGLYNVEMIVNNTCDISFADTLVIPILISDTSEAPIPDTSLIDICYSDSTLINGTYESTAGIYENVVSSIHGCDSLTYWDLYVLEVDSSVNREGITLTANETDAIYQWINCTDGTAVPGATEQEFTPEINGNYAVIVEKDGCMDTSGCYNLIFVGVEDMEQNKFSLYPNPFNDKINLTYSGQETIESVKVYDFTGREINANFSGNNEIIIQDETVNGAYILEITLSSGDTYFFQVFKG